MSEARTEQAQFCWRPVLVVAAFVAVVLGATANQYGYHRDELYFRLLAGHPAVSYIDEPPLTPMLVRVSTAIFGDSLWALRLPAIICAVVTVVLVALVCRELGGGRYAQIVAAIGASSAFLLISGHVFLTATPDMITWTLTILFVTRALLRDEPKWWLWAGVTVGVSFYNKQLIVLLLVGLAVGLLISGPRRVLASRWVWLGVAIAIVIGLPTLIYQAVNGFPELHMAAAIADHKGGDDRVQFIPFQLVLLSPVLVPIWVAGLIGMLRWPPWRPIRALGWAYPVVAVIVLASGGQIYYTFGLLALYLAAGCVRAERWVAAGGRARPAWIAVALVLSFATSAVIALPVIGVSALPATGIGRINQTTRDQIGWPAYTREVGAAYNALSAADRAVTTLIAGNYGEAGALDKYGSTYELPQVFSGQNQLYQYGPPPAKDSKALIVGLSVSDMAGTFRDCEQVGTLDDDVNVDNEEQGRLILFCQDPLGPWSRIWPLFQHYD